MPYNRSHYPILLFAVVTAMACMSQRRGLTYELTDYQKRHGVVREIECATAHSVYKWDVAEVGVSSDPIGPPLEAKAKKSFLTPLNSEHYLEVCDAAASRSIGRAEAKILKLGGTKETHTTKEESIRPTEFEEQKELRWANDGRYAKIFREGSCLCKDQKAEKLNRTVFCTQEYSFDLSDGSEEQRCYGYFTKALLKVPTNELVLVAQRDFCVNNTAGWTVDCQNHQTTYKQSAYFSAANLEPGKCQTTNKEFYHPCECSTDVMNLLPSQGMRFYCTRTFGEEEVILNLDSPSGN